MSNGALRRLRLFHCYPPQAHNFFREEKLWFSALADLNDPFEGMPSFAKDVQELTLETLKKDFVFQHPSGPGWPQYLKHKAPQALSIWREMTYAMQEKVRVLSRSHFRFFSFTSVFPDAAMWGHYAGCHRGFVVEFRPEHPIFADLKEVYYDNKRPQASEILDLRFLQFKDACWRHEAEYRLIKEIAHLEEGERQSDHKRLHFARLPREAIKGVFIGWQMPPDIADQMVADVANCEIEKYVMIPSTSLYTVEAHPLDKVAPLPDDIREAFGLGTLSTQTAVGNTA